MTKIDEKDKVVRWRAFGRKPVAYSTKACSDLILEMAKDGETVAEMRARIYDIATEARNVLSAYIKCGFGDWAVKYWVDCDVMEPPKSVKPKQISLLKEGEDDDES